MFEELLELYEKLDPLEIVAPPAHTSFMARIGVLLDLNGNLLAAKSIKEMVIIPCTEKSEYRTSNESPHLIHDNLSYVASLPGYESRHEKYLQQLETYVEQVEDPLARAVYIHAQKDQLLLEVKPIADTFSFPIEGVNIVFCIHGMETTLNRIWEKHYVSNLPINGTCGITGQPAYIPEGYPRSIRKAGDMAKLFSISKKNIGNTVASTPGYVTAQKICHTLSWLASQPDTLAGDGESNLYTTLREFCRERKINIENLKEKIIEGTVDGMVQDGKWFVDINALTKSPSPHEE